MSSPSSVPSSSVSTGSSAEHPAPSPGDPGRRRGISLALRGQDVGLVVVLLALCVLFGFLTPHFATRSNLPNVLQSVSIIGTVAAVLTLVLVCGALDLSVGSVIGLSGVVSALTVADLGWGPALGYGAAVLVGLLCGFVNGAAVVWLRINPIIVTIGTLSLFRGIAFIATDGRDIAVTDTWSQSLGFDRWLLVPAPVWIMAAVFLATWWVARFTVPGRVVYAIGANSRAARLAGLPVERTRLWIMIISGGAAALAGVLLNAQAGIASPAGGTGYELQVLTAVLLGGTSLAGGQGRVTGTLLGVLIIGVINNGMSLLTVPSYYQTVAGGALLLLAVAVDQARRRAGYR